MLVLVLVLVLQRKGVPPGSQTMPAGERHPCCSTKGALLLTVIFSAWASTMSATFLNALALKGSAAGCGAAGLAGHCAGVAVEAFGCGTIRH